MAAPSAQRYIESQVLTASPEQLVLILYDGAIRFSVRAQDALRRKQAPEAGDFLVRAQRIVLELLCALRPDADPGISRNLSALYSFAYEQLVWANVDGDAAKVEAVVRILQTLRDGWAEAIEKHKKEGVR